MAHSTTERRRVYLACRAIFSGENAQLRKRKNIQKVIAKRQSLIQALLKDLGTNKVIDITKDLLEKRIFQSEIQAKIEFPELFQSLPERAIQRAESENEAARSTREALEEAISDDGEAEADRGGNVDPFMNTGFPFGTASTVVRSTAGAENGLASPTNVLGEHVPSLYPSYFPYKAQHIILSIVQQRLEECCFDFAKQWMPSLLHEQGWDCSEAVELTKWTRLLVKRSGKLSNNAFARVPGIDLNEALVATHKVRHSAVHRLSTTAREVKRLVEVAMRFTEMLRDTVRTAQLEDLHHEIDSKIRAMELNKNALEDNVSGELQRIQEQREELDRMESVLIESMVREDKDNKSLIGMLLEESVQRIFDEEAEEQTGSEKDEAEDPVLKVDEEAVEATDAINEYSETATQNDPNEIGNTGEPQMD